MSASTSGGTVLTPLTPFPLSALRTPQRRHSAATSRLHAPLWALVSLPVGPRSARLACGGRVVGRRSRHGSFLAQARDLVGGDTRLEQDRVGVGEVGRAYRRARLRAVRAGERPSDLLEVGAVGTARRHEDLAGTQVLVARERG